MTRLLALLPLLLAFGCSSTTPTAPSGPGRADELREVGLLLSTHSAAGKKGPPTPAELSGYEQAFPLAVRDIRAGDIIAFWGAAPASEGEVAAGRGGTNVIAYEKKVPAEGGSVLLQNGTVKQMTAEEFKAAPKAK